MDRNYNNVLSYSESDMVTLCRTKAIATSNDCSFIRTENKVKTHFTYNQCLQANYIAFRNPDYSNKWFFAWIDDVIYKGDNNTEITFTVDSWATWFDKWTKKACYVIREHVNDDTIGLHTVPENIDIGDLISDWSSGLSSDGLTTAEWYWIVIASNFNPTTNLSYSAITVHDNYPQGCQWFAWKISSIYPTQLNDVNTWLHSVATAQHIPEIISIFVLPECAISDNDVDANTHLVDDSIVPKGIDKTFAKNTFYTFDDYTTVKNNKLYCYPYNFIRVSNNQGSFNDYKIEEFYDDEEDIGNINFRIFLCACQGYAGQLNPLRYQKTSGYNYDEALQLGKYPTLSWTTDSYTNWLATQDYNVATGVWSSSVSSISSLASGNPIGALNNISSTILNTIGTIRDASMQPNGAKGNVNAGDIGFNHSTTTFEFKRMRPKKEYLSIIDNYLNKFGYKICEVKQPNITGRTYWNYIEIGSTEEIGYGDVPQKYMDDINNACRKGVTIWHSHANLGNFSLTNSIVT